MDLSDGVKREARQRKSRRTRRLLIVAVALLLVCVAAGVGFGIYYLTQQEAPASSTGKDLPSTTGDATVKAKVVSTVPGLSGFFGETVDQVLSKLGSPAALASTVDATDPTVPAVVRLAEVDIAAKDASSSQSSKGGASSGAFRGARLYLSLDADGKVVKTNYSVPLGNLGNTDMLFADLLVDRAFLQDTLRVIGVSGSSYEPPIPDVSSYQTFGVGTDGKQMVTKESYTYSGQTGLDSAPMTWSITYTFDHTIGATSTSQTVVADDASRMLGIVMY